MVDRDRRVRPDEMTAERSAHAVFTSRLDGDVGVDAPPHELAARRATIAAFPWTWMHQVHGADVVVVERPGDHAGAHADAAVSATPGAALAVQTADCAGVLFDGIGGDGTGLDGTGVGATATPILVIGAAHAGWRGLEAGVLQRTVQAMRSLGAEHIRWRLGPCISPAAYEFGTEDLDRLADRYGDELRGTTSWGSPSLDLRSGVRAALAEVGADERGDQDPPCTASDERYYSFRARRDAGRQAAVTWIEPPRSPT